MKLQEIFNSFVYEQPEDPEKILYDFYFLVAYVYGVDFNYQKDPDSPIGASRVTVGGGDSLNFIMDEAVKDCVDLLTDHMILALKYCMSAEFKHITDYCKLLVNLSPLPPEEARAKLKSKVSESTYKFLARYLTIFPMYYTPSGGSASELFTKFSPEADIRSKHYKGLVTKNDDEKYAQQYKAVVKTQSQLKYSNNELADVFIEVFSDSQGWNGAYGGKNWQKIAECWKKLLESTKTSDKIVWCDHAYDLQHNTGSVFTKLQKYYKGSGFSWLKNALDWKRDNKTLKNFYDKVSTQLKPIVAYVNKHATGESLLGKQYEVPAIQKIQAAVQGKDEAVPITSIDDLHEGDILVYKSNFSTQYVIEAIRTNPFRLQVKNISSGTITNVENFDNLKNYYDIIHKDTSSEASQTSSKDLSLAKDISVPEELHVGDTLLSKVSKQGYEIVSLTLSPFELKVQMPGKKSLTSFKSFSVLKTNYEIIPKEEEEVITKPLSQEDIDNAQPIQSEKELKVGSILVSKDTSYLNYRVVDLQKSPFKITIERIPNKSVSEVIQMSYSYFTTVQDHYNIVKTSSPKSNELNPFDIPEDKWKPIYTFGEADIGDYIKTDTIMMKVLDKDKDTIKAKYVKKSGEEDNKYPISYDSDDSFMSSMKKYTPENVDDNISLGMSKVSGEPITSFDDIKVGHYYKWIGPKSISELPKGHDWVEEMQFMMDGKPHKCVKVGNLHPSVNKKRFVFEESPGRPTKEHEWWWDNMVGNLVDLGTDPLESKEIEASSSGEKTLIKDYGVENLKVGDIIYNEEDTSSYYKKKGIIVEIKKSLGAVRIKWEVEEDDSLTAYMASDLDTMKFYVIPETPKSSSLEVTSENAQVGKKVTWNPKFTGNKDTFIIKSISSRIIELQKESDDSLSKFWIYHNNNYKNAEYNFIYVEEPTSIKKSSLETATFDTIKVGDSLKFNPEYLKFMSPNISPSADAFSVVATVQDIDIMSNEVEVYLSTGTTTSFSSMTFDGTSTEPPVFVFLNKHEGEEKSPTKEEKSGYVTPDNVEIGDLVKWNPELYPKLSSDKLEINGINMDTDPPLSVLNLDTQHKTFVFFNQNDNITSPYNLVFASQDASKEKSGDVTEDNVEVGDIIKDKVNEEIVVKVLEINEYANIKVEVLHYSPFSWAYTVGATQNVYLYSNGDKKEGSNFEFYSNPEEYADVATPEPEKKDPDKFNSEGKELVTMENAEVGIIVERNKDKWNFTDQDGREGSKGILYEVLEKQKWARVYWVVNHNNNIYPISKEDGFSLLKVGEPSFETMDNTPPMNTIVYNITDNKYYQFSKIHSETNEVVLTPISSVDYDKAVPYEEFIQNYKKVVIPE